MTQSPHLPTPPALELHSINGARGESILFERISIKLFSGNILQVLGVNGGGKTTLLRIIAGLHPPTKGAVLWYGHPIETSMDYQIQSLYLGHLNGLKAELTVRENLLTNQRLSKQTPHTELSIALERLGLTGFGNTRVGRLSAGQRRKAALARLAYERAALWILDEPFTALDGAGIEAVHDLMRNHLTRGGIIAFTSHQRVEFAADEIRTLTLGI